MIIDEDFASLHGYLCADGYVSQNLHTQKHKYYIVGLRNTEDRLLEDFQERFRSYFDISPRLIKGQRCHIYSKYVYSRLIDFGPFHSNNWQFPDLPPELMKYWLRAVFDCEGWVTCRKGKDRRIGLEMINHEGVLLISKILNDIFSIPNKVYMRKNRKTYAVHIYGKKNLIKFREMIGFLHPKKKEKLDKAINSYVDYDWGFPVSQEELKEIFLSKARVKKPNTLRIVSKIEANLIFLSKELNNRFSINSKVYSRTNGLGNRYFELAIYRREDVMRLAEMGFLDKRAKDRLLGTI